MNSEILEYLEKKRKPSIFKPGEIIFFQDEPVAEFYYIKSGLSLTYTILEDGRERNILVSWPQRFFGISTFFDGGVHRSSAIALKKCEIIVIDKVFYAECAAKFPDFQTLLITELSKDINTLFEHLSDSSMLNSDINVARFICRRLSRGQHTDSNGRPVLNYTQDFIATVLGLSRWSVNKALASFRAKGWLLTGHGTITVIDPDKIREFGYENGT